MTALDEAQQRTLDDFQRWASQSRETCLICGMVANIDPSFHHERYGHVPEVGRDGERCRFDYHTYTFRPVRKGE